MSADSVQGGRSSSNYNKPSFTHATHHSNHTTHNNTSPPSSTERRRQWPLARGLLSQTTSSPSAQRRRAGLLPRVLPTASKPPAPPPRPPDLHVEIDPQAAVPVIVARSPDVDGHHPPATRTVSSPTRAEHSRSARSSTSSHRRRRRTDQPYRTGASTPPPLPSPSDTATHQGAAATTTTTTTSTTAATTAAATTAQGRRRFRVRLAMRRSRSGRESISSFSEARGAAARKRRDFDDERTLPETVHTTESDASPSHRLSRDTLCDSDMEPDGLPSKPSRRHTTPAGEAPVSARFTAAVESSIPAYVLQGNATFEPNAFEDYRRRIDQLSNDDRFMHYLTAPVGRRAKSTQTHGPIGHRSTKSTPHPPQLAVNKLYPLAFIRLLEAHAKHAAESDGLGQVPMHSDRFGYDDEFEDMGGETVSPKHAFMAGRFGAPEFEHERRRSVDPHGIGLNPFDRRSRSTEDAVHLIRETSPVPANHKVFRSPSQGRSLFVPVC